MDVSGRLDALTGLPPKDGYLGTHWKGGRVSLRAGLKMNIILGPAGNRISFVEPVVRHSQLAKT
jgi:hypothetical protein